MKILIIVLLVALFACGGVTVFAPGSSSDLDNQVELDVYRVRCKSGCKQLFELKDYDGKKPCMQARNHNGLDCVEYCIYKMQTDSSTDPICWRELQSCNDFEEKCHFGELY